MIYQTHKHQIKDFQQKSLDLKTMLLNAWQEQKKIIIIVTITLIITTTIIIIIIMKTKQ